MAFSLAACGNNSTPAGGSSANAGTSTPAASTPASGGIEPIELTIYSPGNENSVPTKTIIEYAHLVNEASDGASPWMSTTPTSWAATPNLSSPPAWAPST